jgi:ferritin-like metal-binding protein YciE
MLLAAENQQILTLGLAASQTKVEQLEIACYRALIQTAEQMGQQQAVKLLQQNLQQEEQTAKKLEQHMPQLLKECK